MHRDDSSIGDKDLRPSQPQLATSHVQPRTLNEYMEFFDRKDVVEGFLEKKLQHETNWTLCWFELKECMLRWNASGVAGAGSESEWDSIPMESVISFRTDPRFGSAALTISTTQQTLSLKATTVEQMQRWLFAFQKSVAAILTQILHRYESGHVGSGLGLGLGSGLNRPLGYGHGHRLSARNSNESPMSRSQGENNMFPPGLGLGLGLGIPSWSPLQRSTSAPTECFDTPPRSALGSRSQFAPKVSSPQIPLVQIPLQKNDDDPYQFFRRDTGQSQAAYRPLSSPERVPVHVEEVRGGQGEIFDLELETSSQSDTTEHDVNLQVVSSTMGSSYFVHQTHCVWGSATEQGPRSSQQDRICIVEDLRSMNNSTSVDEQMSYFAIFDGHCGHEIAELAAQRLPLLVSSSGNFPHDIKRSLEAAILQMDIEALNFCEINRYDSGTTALVAIVSGNQLKVANVGDSFGVLSRNGVAVPISIPHKPGREDERQRIEAANGWVTEERELFVARLRQMDLSDPSVVEAAQRMTWVTIHRVCGDLAVSRALGDRDFKNFAPGVPSRGPFMWPEGHSQCFSADLIISDPDMHEETITIDDQFFILACDGVWDVLDQQEAVNYVRDQLASGQNPEGCAQALTSYALRLGSSDNVSVIVVQFKHTYTH